MIRSYFFPNIPNTPLSAFKAFSLRNGSSYLLINGLKPGAALKAAKSGSSRTVCNYIIFTQYCVQKDNPASSAVIFPNLVISSISSLKRFMLSHSHFLKMCYKQDQLEFGEARFLTGGQYLWQDVLWYTHSHISYGTCVTKKLIIVHTRSKYQEINLKGFISRKITSDITLTL